MTKAQGDEGIRYFLSQGHEIFWREYSAREIGSMMCCISDANMGFLRICSSSDCCSDIDLFFFLSMFGRGYWENELRMEPQDLSFDKFRVPPSCQCILPSSPHSGQFFSTAGPFSCMFSINLCPV